MPESSKWAAYDVARSRILLDIGDLSQKIAEEQAKPEPDQIRVETMEAEIEALDLQYDFLHPDAQ